MSSPAFIAFVTSGVVLLTAGLGAFATLTTFVGSRDVKISEFRQNWIEALRSAVIEFCAASRLSASLLSSGAERNTMQKGEQARFAEEQASRRKAIATSYHAVTLLLNLNEVLHLNLKSRIGDVQTMLDRRAFSMGDFQVKLDLVEKAAADVFKREWKVIKTGDKTGRRWLMIATSGVGATILGAAFLIGYGISNDQGTTSQREASALPPKTSAEANHFHVDSTGALALRAWIVSEEKDAVEQKRSSFPLARLLNLIELLAKEGAMTVADAAALTSELRSAGIAGGKDIAVHLAKAIIDKFLASKPVPQQIAFSGATINGVSIQLGCPTVPPPKPSPRRPLKSSCEIPPRPACCPARSAADPIAEKNPVVQVRGNN